MKLVKFQGKNYYGFKSPIPKWLKKKLIESVGFCEDCQSKENLEIHRPIRQADGGLYMCVTRDHPLSNCKVVCNDCHKKYNY
jgi:hypothetical protein